ncbi:unnamed protein product [Protopolystoma xenopodis]|uniref:Uncharacterized protein n=1 Tax=Protopolystoma xenopodis TaxID=117903 RepID=A0A3S5AUH8_9PLAT|nr:unnamed protein product [Protopolystoma xenopodis]
MTANQIWGHDPTGLRRVIDGRQYRAINTSEPYGLNNYRVLQSYKELLSLSTDAPVYSDLSVLSLIT